MEINGYQLSRSWFDFCFANPELINPNHTAIFTFAIEHCNRLGWKEKFGFPSQMTMDALGIKNHHTFIKYFNDLVDWGFFKLVQKSTNQYSANIISLQCGKLKNGKALDKAFITHASKQPSEQQHINHQSTPQSNDSIDKPINQLTSKPINQHDVDFFLEVKNVGGDIYTDEMLKRFSEYWTEPIVKGKDIGKEKWQGEKTWKLTQRLSKWAERNLDGIVCYREDDKSIKDKKIAFKTELKPFLEIYGKDMINAFFLHWTQPENVKHPKKLKWELEDSWELKNRLISWKAREDARQDPAKKEEKLYINPKTA